MDFREQRDAIINFIDKNYEEYLWNNLEKPFITDEFLDFDRFKHSFICVIEFDSSTFSTSDQFNDDCVKTENLLLNIFLVHRNNTPSKLNEDMLNSTSAFYKMIHSKDISGIITSHINRVDFFRYIEGSNNIVASKITLNLNIEI